MVRSIVTSLLSILLLFLSGNAFRQAISELRDTEPGSMLFGVLQVVIGSSAIAAVLGLVFRKRLASWSIGVCALAAVVLLVVQPLFEPMPMDAQRSIWLGAALVMVTGAAMIWFARWLSRVSGSPTAAPVTSPRALASADVHDDASRGASSNTAPPPANTGPPAVP